MAAATQVNQANQQQPQQPQPPQPPQQHGHGGMGQLGNWVNQWQMQNPQAYGQLQSALQPYQAQIQQGMGQLQQQLPQLVQQFSQYWPQLQGMFGNRPPDVQALGQQQGQSSGGGGAGTQQDPRTGGAPDPFYGVELGNRMNIETHPYQFQQWSGMDPAAQQAFMANPAPPRASGSLYPNNFGFEP